MAEYIVNRPDEEVMRRILQQNPDNAVGAILRLAWQAGLLREDYQLVIVDTEGNIYYSPSLEGNLQPNSQNARGYQFTAYEGGEES